MRPRADVLRLGVLGTEARKTHHLAVDSEHKRIGRGEGPAPEYLSPAVLVFSDLDLRGFARKTDKPQKSNQSKNKNLS